MKPLTLHKVYQAHPERAEYPKLIRSAAEQYLPKRFVRKYCRMMLETFDTEGNIPSIELKDRYGFSSTEEFLKFTAILFGLSKELPFSKYKMSIFEKLNIVNRLIETFDDAKVYRRSDRNNLFKCAALLAYEDSYESFKFFSPSLQINFYSLCRRSSLSVGYTLIKMIHKSDLVIPLSHLVIMPDKVGHFTQMADNATKRSIMRDQLESAPFSDEFCKLAFLDKQIDRYWHPYAPEQTLERFGDSKAAILTLFRAYYGERVLLDLIQYCESSFIVLSPDVMMNILDEWKLNGDYPIEWIMGMR